MSWCGYSWVTYRGTALVGSHECRLEHGPDDPDPVHVCARCFVAPAIDRASSQVVDSLSENIETEEVSKIPKLDNPTARTVAKAEGSGSTLLDEDQYRLKLEKVIVAPKPDKNGDAYWVWTWQVVSGQTTGDRFKGKSTRCATWFLEDRAWYPKMIFEAFGVKPNVDTDTLLGKEVLAIVTQSEITSGSRKGQMGNDISTFMSPDSATDDDWDDEDESAAKDAAGAPEDDDGEPDF